MATAVQLRFDVVHSPSLQDEVTSAFFKAAGKRISKEGVIVITAQRFRTQGANRQDAVERLVELIRQAARKPLVRHKTRPTRASKNAVLRLNGAVPVLRSCAAQPQRITMIS